MFSDRMEFSMSKKHHDKHHHKKHHHQESDNSFSAEQEYTSSRYANFDQNPYGEGREEFDGFSNRREMIFASLQNYWGNSKVMMASSLSHLRSPITIAVIFLLIAVYIFLGIVGTVEFSFYNRSVVQYITTNLDIIVNALLGYFFGPVTAAISVTLCTLVRMIFDGNGFFFIGYVLLAAVAGFCHGWILYRHKTMWFGTRFRGFFSDLLVKAFQTRAFISIVINILLKAVISKIFFHLPIYSYTILNYEKSGVKLESFGEFLGVFSVNLLFETLIVFLGLAIINFIISKAFPLQASHPTLIIKADGTIINPEDELVEDNYF